MDSPGDWRRRAGRPRQSWLRTVEADLRPMNSYGKSTHPGQIGMAATCGNCYVFDKLLKREKKKLGYKREFSTPKWLW